MNLPLSRNRSLLFMRIRWIRCSWNNRPYQKKLKEYISNKLPDKLPNLNKSILLTIKKLPIKIAINIYTKNNRKKNK